MCVIIHRPEGRSIPKEILKNAMGHHKDGWGMMFVDDGRVRTIKSRDYDAFWQEYRQLGRREVGIHFRRQTRGDINEDMCHPFAILSDEVDGMDLYLMHNGTIYDVQGEDKTLSDTWYFVNKYLRPVLTESPDMIDNPAFRRMVYRVLGKSRLLLLDDNKRVRFFNRAEGIEIQGIWLSNDYSHEPPKPAYTPTSYSYPAVGFKGGSGFATAVAAIAPVNGKTEPSPAAPKAPASASTEPVLVAVPQSAPWSERSYGNGRVWGDEEEEEEIENDSLYLGFDPNEYYENGVDLETFHGLAYDEIQQIVYECPDLVAGLLYDLTGDARFGVAAKRTSYA